MVIPLLVKIGKLHQRETSGKMPLKLSFNFSLFIIIIFFDFSTLQCYMWHSILKQKVMFNLQSFIYSMY